MPQAVLPFLETTGISVIGDGVAVQFLAEVVISTASTRNRHGGEVTQTPVEPVPQSQGSKVSSYMGVPLYGGHMANCHCRNTMGNLISLSVRQP